MSRTRMQSSLKFSMLFMCSIFPMLLSTITSVNALNIGIQATNSGGITAQCSRKCESEHCTVPPLLRYGKYCGILYTGCPGEEPCDALDACCMVHDNCVAAKNEDYLNEECNGNLLSCLAGVKKSGKGTFKDNKCKVGEVVDEITLVIEAAVLAGRVLDKP